jgi:hypothetical protein
MFKTIMEQYYSDPKSAIFKEDADIISDEFDPVDNAIDDAILPKDDVADDDLDDVIEVDPDETVAVIDQEIDIPAGDDIGPDIGDDDIDDSFEDEVKGALIDDDAFDDDDLTIFDTKADDVGDVVDDVVDDAATSGSDPLAAYGLDLDDDGDEDDD